MYRILKSLDSDQVIIRAADTGQEINLRESDLLDLQKEINLTYPLQEQSPVIQVVYRTLVEIARGDINADTRLSACRLLLSLEEVEQEKTRLMLEQTRLRAKR